jgi:hypothetical protein
MAESKHTDRSLWFGKKEGGTRFAPLTWQGRAATFLYVLLVIVAIFTYSQLTLTAFVVIFYTVAFGIIVVYKSDLMDNWPPGSGPPGESRSRTGRR